MNSDLLKSKSESDTSFNIVLKCREAESTATQSKSYASATCERNAIDSAQCLLCDDSRGILFLD